MLKVVLVALFLSAVSGTLTWERQKIESAVSNWTRAASGFPIQCYRYVTTFTDNGHFTYPQFETGALTSLTGQRTMFGFCEKHLLTGFDQLETFVTSPIMIHDNQASFYTNTLVVTKERCRFVLQAIHVAIFNDKYKITDLTSHWDTQRMHSEWAKCHLVDSDIEQAELSKEDL